MSVLSMRDLSVEYRTTGGDVPAVRGVDLEVDRGEVLGLAGESGCGKSTIAGAILRLLPAKTKITGRIELDGNDILELTPGKLRAVRWTAGSIVFQGAMHAMNPVQRIGEQIMEPILVHGQSGEREARMRAGTLLEQVGLPTRRLDDYPHELSGGQKQRIMIAMALACSPSLIALLFITHDLSVLVEVADRLAIMYAGKIVEQGDAEAVFHSPAHPYTKALAAAFPAIGDMRFRGHPSGLGGDPPDPQQIPSGCPFHPRCAEVTPACSSVTPDLWTAGPARLAACVHVSGAPALEGVSR
ncbi:MAG: ABC transporter ATP-binding protein [Actinobacteria bacterium]|nr:MAG: ABC transporter ATP-binding protein [Actinomycetota bacterium]